MNYNRKYEEALEKARAWWEEDAGEQYHPMRDELEKIFPELKEGECEMDESDIWAIIHLIDNTFKRDDVTSVPRSVLEELIVDIYDMLKEIVQ